MASGYIKCSDQFQGEISIIKYYKLISKSILIDKQKYMQDYYFLEFSYIFTKGNVGE